LNILPAGFSACYPDGETVVCLRHINISADKADAIRALLHRAAKRYDAEDGQEIRKRMVELAGPVAPGEFPALCKHIDRIEVVSHAEYLNDVKKERWH
jgi:hypothetical protein